MASGQRRPTAHHQGQNRSSSTRPDALSSRCFHRGAPCPRPLFSSLLFPCRSTVVLLRSAPPPRGKPSRFHWLSLLFSPIWRGKTWWALTIPFLPSLFSRPARIAASALLPRSVARAGMFRRLIGRKPKKAPSALSTLDKLHETLEMLEKKEDVLQKKISREVEKAKDLTRLKNKAAAIQCLKKKKLYEAQIEQLGNFQLRVHDQIIMLESSKATTETINALKTGASAVKSIQQSLSIDDIDKTMEQVNEQAENMKHIQEALASPSYVMADFDEDELEAELEEMEELEELQAPQAIQTSTPSTEDLPERATSRPSGKVKELESLQAEMAL
uniref:Vacuolar protein sorting-associated protein 32 1 n=1 Tax=Anthurium amnicola TaxID=1678845 RepID=A0A1D1XP15_9ARAE